MTDQLAVHVSLRNMRRASGLTLTQVSERASEFLGRTMSRGTLSAIENGQRGASHEVLSALELVYDLDPGDLLVDYNPRASTSQTSIRT